MTRPPGASAARRPLPASLLDALRGEEVVLVTSRDHRRQGTVPMWFAIAPPGVVYLFTHAFSRKVERWRRDPWVRLCPPAGAPAVEGEVHFVESAELAEVAELVVDRWVLAGAVTPAALHRLVGEGTHALVRVEALRGAAPSE